MTGDSETFIAEVAKVQDRIYQVQHDGGEPGRWALVEKRELSVLVEEARLWEVHGKDILDAHNLLAERGEAQSKRKGQGAVRT